MSICHNCGAEIAADALFCPKCGAKKDSAKPEEEKKETGKRTCRKCGAELEEGTAFCQACGEPVEEENAETEEK